MELPFLSCDIATFAWFDFGHFQSLTIQHDRSCHHSDGSRISQSAHEWRWEIRPHIADYERCTVYPLTHNEVEGAAIWKASQAVLRFYSHVETWNLVHTVSLEASEMQPFGRNRALSLVATFLRHMHRSRNEAKCWIILIYSTSEIFDNEIANLRMEQN